MVAKTPSQKRDETLPKTNNPGPGSPDRFGGKPRGRARANLRETTRLLKAIRRAGGFFRLEFTPEGRPFIVDQASATTNTDTDTDPNPWDEVHAENKKRST
jgi:hypothetical protein